MVLLRQASGERGLEERDDRPHEAQRLATERQVLGGYRLELCGGVDGAGSEHQLRRARVEYLLGRGGNALLVMVR